MQAQHHDITRYFFSDVFTDSLIYLKLFRIFSRVLFTEGIPREVWQHRYFSFAAYKSLSLTFPRAEWIAEEKDNFDFRAI